jgi:hypothetical protein
MGNAIKRVADCTLSFFRKVKNLICDVSQKVVEVIVNGVKTVVNYFKKVFVYIWNKIKIIGKLLYYGGKQIIQILTNKLGILNLIQFFNELIKKKVQVRDQNNNNITDPQSFFVKLANQMKPNYQIQINTLIIPIQNEREEEETIIDFTENDKFSDIPGLSQNDSVACTDDREIKFDTISRTNTNYSLNSNISNYSSFSNYSNYSSRSNNSYSQYYYK